MYTLSGVSIAAGVGFAPAVTVSRPGRFNTEDKLYAIDPQEEIDKFQKKSTQFANRLRQIVNPGQDRIRDLFGAAAGFLTDKGNNHDIIDLINRGCSAITACKSVLLGKLESFNHSKDPELLNDNKEIKSLLLEFIGSLHKRDDSTVVLPNLKEKAVIVAENLSPALFLSLDVEKVHAVVLEFGRDSGHLGVVLRELGIPAIFGVQGATSIENGTKLLVDGNNGVLVVDPEENTAKAMLEKLDLFHEVTTDDSLINVTIAGAVGAIRQLNGNSLYTTHGLGLLRSEFLFLGYDHEPTEEEMTEAFAKLFNPISPTAPITARTFDFADDKKPLFRVHLDDQGPLKGYGAEVGSRLLKKEIRALLRAACGRNIRIIFPLITRLSEALYLKNLAISCCHELSELGIQHGSYEVGFMSETPSSVLCAQGISVDCSMIIIGTSSLAEYASAPRPADIAFTPALAKMIVMAAKAAHEAHIPIGVAGRYAPRIELLPFFYKLGVTYYAVDGYQIGRMRNAVEQLNLDTQLEPAFDLELYNEVMNLFTGKELAALINRLNMH